MKTSPTLDAEKKHLIKSIEEINDGLLLKSIENLIEFARQKDEAFLGESLEEYNLALEEADSEIDKGNFMVHEEAIKKMGEWKIEK
jgi:hypothetical protein